MAEKNSLEIKKPHGEKPPEKKEESEMFIRVSGYDLPGSKDIYAGLTRIKGISWSVANAICFLLKIQKTKKVSELSKEDIKKIESFLSKISGMPAFLQNRRSDIDTGETKHYLGSNLEIKKEFDIKRLKEIRSYRGLRHALKLPVRGQRTRSHFRNRGAALGVKRKKG